MKKTITAPSNTKPASSQRVKILLVLALAAVTGAILVTYGVTPFTSFWQKQSQELAAQQQLLTKMETAAQHVPRLQNDFSTLSQKIQARLPSEREQSQFLSAIGDVASQTNVLISSMNPRPLRDVGAFKELSVEIDMEANLGNLVRFLYYMRKGSVVLVANRLWLQPKEERSALLKGHLVISTIFLKEK